MKKLTSVVIYMKYRLKSVTRWRINPFYIVGGWSGFTGSTGSTGFTAGKPPRPGKPVRPRSRVNLVSVQAFYSLVRNTISPFNALFLNNLIAFFAFLTFFSDSHWSSSWPYPFQFMRNSVRSFIFCYGSSPNKTKLRDGSRLLLPGGLAGLLADRICA